MYISWHITASGRAYWPKYGKKYVDHVCMPACNTICQIFHPSLLPPPSALLCLHCGRLLNNLLTALGLVCNLILPLIVCCFFIKNLFGFCATIFYIGKCGAVNETVFRGNNFTLMCSQISPLNVLLFLLFPILSAFFVFDRSLPTMHIPWWNFINMFLSFFFTPSLQYLSLNNLLPSIR